MQAKEWMSVTPENDDAPAPDTVEDLEPARVVEAALFSAGKPLALEDIAENTGLGKRAVQKALATLEAEYSESDTALEVGRAGEKWAMQVKAKYARATERLAPMEIPERVLKTLALVAYHQPILQSDLVAMVGAKAYDHVRELYDRGLVRRRVHDRSFMLLTTERFPEYFGIPAQDREEIKRFLAEKLGIRVGPKPAASAEAEAQVDAAPAGDAKSREIEEEIEQEELAEAAAAEASGEPVDAGRAADEERAGDDAVAEPARDAAEGDDAPSESTSDARDAAAPAPAKPSADEGGDARRGA